MNEPITYVITDLNVGGVPLHLARLAPAVRDHGFKPRVVSLAPMGEVGRRLLDCDIPVESCHARGAWDVGVIRRLARILKRHQSSLTHALLFHANVATSLASGLAGIPKDRVICEIQTVEIERRWHLTVGEMVQGMSACIIGNSPSVVNHLKQRGKIIADRLRCVEGGVDIAAIAAAIPYSPDELGIPPDTQIILWVGRVDPVKGLDELLPAFKNVAPLHRTRLLLVGDGPYKSHIEALIDNLGLNENVTILGIRKDVPRLLKSADVFTFPSRTEGMPNALLEAMAAGLPVLTTDVAGCRDVVSQGETGILVPCGDVAALSRELNRLLTNASLRKKLGTNAARHVADRYSFDRCVERYVSLYREVLAAAPSSGN